MVKGVGDLLVRVYMKKRSQEFLKDAWLACWGICMKIIGFLVEGFPRWAEVLDVVNLCWTLMGILVEEYRGRMASGVDFGALKEF